LNDAAQIALARPPIGAALKDTNRFVLDNTAPVVCKAFRIAGIQP
jgi:hypothetical protein